MVALDPLSSVASALEADFDTSNAEYAAFFDAPIRPLVQCGVTVLLVDNVGHNVEAKGVSAKQDKADVILAGKAASVPSGAALALTVTKARSMRAPFRKGARWGREAA